MHSKLHFTAKTQFEKNVEVVSINLASSAEIIQVYTPDGANLDMSYDNRGSMIG